MKAPNVMASINRSAGIPNQAQAAVIRIAQLEQERQRHLSRGHMVAAGRTLGAMAETFEKAPTTEELRAVVANEMPRGEMMSGRAYYENLTTGKDVATYFVGATAPDKMRDYVRSKNLQYAVSYAVPARLTDFVQGGVQAAAYHYVTAQEREVGSGLGASMPMSTAEQASKLLRARERAAYMVSVAALNGLGALGGITEATALAIVNAIIDVVGAGGDIENNVSSSLTSALDNADNLLVKFGPLIPPLFCQLRKSARQVRGVREGFNKALSARGVGPVPATCPDEQVAAPAKQAQSKMAAPSRRFSAPQQKTNWMLIGGVAAAALVVGGGAWWYIRRRRTA